MIKQCTSCKQEKPLLEFSKAKKTKTGFSYWCKQCQREWVRENWGRVYETQRRYVASHPTLILRTKRKYVQKTARQQNASARARYAENRQQAFSHYGDSCACCGIADVALLCIDHIHRNGAAHRRTFSGDILRWLKRNNYPSGFRTLCRNCNKSLGLYGYCPHSNAVAPIEIPRAPDKNVTASRTNSYTRRYYRRKREDALAHYGGACVHCRESRYEYLDFDHIGGGGTKHRNNGIRNIVSWLRKQGYPPVVRVLCHNCNWRAFIKSAPNEP